MAMHVHIAVPSADTAIAALNGIRERLPLVLALSANSPFWQARDSGLASTRTSLFGAFPRTGLPPYFATYEDWAERVDFLIRSGAIPEPTFLWWDARLQPRFGTIEIRIADTQTRLEDVAALVALMQCLVKEAVEGDIIAEARREAVAENRFLASRDGTEACLIDPHAESLVPLSEWVHDALEISEPHARELDCEAELARVQDLCKSNGADSPARDLQPSGIEAVAPWLGGRAPGLARRRLGARCQARWARCRLGRVRLDDLVERRALRGRAAGGAGGADQVVRVQAVAVL